MKENRRVRGESLTKYVAPFMALLLWSAPQMALADEISPGEELFMFQLGYFFPSFDTKLRVDNGSGGRGDEVNLENDLGYEHNETTLWGSATWRISPRNRLSLGYFKFHRGGDTVLQKQVSIGDDVYPAGAELHSSFDLSIIPISYSFSFIKTDEWEFAGTAGLQWSTLKFDADGSATLGGGGGSAQVRASALAPLPLIGLELTYYITPQWSLGGSLGLFSYKLAASNMNFQGNIASAILSGDWWFSNYVGAGLAVNWFSFDVDVQSKDWNGKLNYQYLGPQIYLTGRF